MLFSYQTLIKLLSCFITIYTIGNAIVFTLSMIFLFGNDGKLARTVSIVAFLHSYITMIVFMDAMPIKARRIMGFVIVLSSFCLCLALLIGIFNKWIPFDDNSIKIGQLKISISNVALSSIFNLLVFASRNLIAIISNPNDFCVLNSSMRSKKGTLILLET